MDFCRVIGEPWDIQTADVGGHDFLSIQKCDDDWVVGQFHVD